MRAEIQKNLRFNFTVNVMDGAFYGFALGFSSFVTVIPLFVSTLTDSSILIGLVASLHLIGFQLPQLLTANRVARLRRYKPLIMFLTINERLPFLFLALVALNVNALGKNLALILTLIFVIWAALGAGLTGNPWQSMIAKIFPPEMRGTFYGTQSAAANLTQSASAVLAGIILVQVAAPGNFALCFFCTAFIMIFSYISLGSAREPDAPPALEKSRSMSEFWRGLFDILRRDGDFRLFLAVRMLAQFAALGTAFFTIYAVRHFSMDDGTAGIMTAVLMLATTVSNPLFGWLGDRYSHRVMFALCILLAGGSSAVALFAPSLGWFYLVFALAGFSSAGLWTTVMAMTVEFGAQEERPYYIGMANTLTAPATLAAPLLGGWLADAVSYQATFAIAAVSGLITVIMIYFMRPQPKQPTSGGNSTEAESAVSEIAEVEPVLVPTSPYLEQI
ncbi:MAG TPA: MFS transporter [Phototrophicaceae bacterium]|nr:MFS transporter [Phototrophicaceae bacterium]